MKKDRMWNYKIKAFFAILLIINASMIYTIPFNIFADENNSLIQSREVFGRDEENVFIEGENGFDNIERKINDEVESHTEMINYDMENYLNERGVYDDEIIDMNCVEELNSINTSDVEVYTAYYAVSDTPDEKDIPITEEEMRVLNCEEVDELIENLYYNGNNEIVKNEDKSNEGIKDIVLTKLGIKPVNAYAETMTAGGGDVTYLKKTIIAYNYKLDGKQYLRLRYITTWTTMPKYRNVDVVSLTWTNATYEYELDDYLWVEQSWDCETGFVVSGTNTIFNKQNSKGSKVFSYHSNPGNLKKSQYYVEGNKIVAAVKLHEDSNTKMYIEDKYYTVKNYYNEKMEINLFLEIDTRKKSSIIIPYYQHFKEDVDVVSVIVDLASNPIIGSYNLASGKYNNANYTYSGVEFRFPYTFKFK